MAKPSVARPFAEGYLHHELRPDEALALLRPRVVGERRPVGFQRSQPGREVLELLHREAGSDLSGVEELAVRVGADQERAEPRPASLRIRVAADHELLLIQALELEPV